MEYKSLYLPDRESWRSWLQKNHDKLPGVWLIYYKKHTGKPRVSYNDAVEEALCFGWIDSTIKRIDVDTYKQKFTPRKPLSSWSAINKKRVEVMMEKGKMTEAGMKAVHIAKKNGKWNETMVPQRSPELAADLMNILRSETKAFTRYQKLTPGRRKNFNGWVMAAKKPEIRLKRCQEMIRLLNKNEELGMR
ncbi:MAG: YdeI/OmpD-associated family protein [bacterium]